MELITVENGQVMVQMKLGNGGESRTQTLERCWIILNHDLSKAQQMKTLGFIRYNVLELGCQYSDELEKAALEAGQRIYLSQTHIH